MTTRGTVFLFALPIALALPSVAGASKTHHPWFSHHKSEAIEAMPTVSDAPVLKVMPTPKNVIREKAESEHTDGQKIVQQALRYRGVKYKFGGNSKYKGFDCSGLVERVYNDLKFKEVPHMSSALYEKGRPVKLSELRAGDLVFFKNTYRSGISHVGIYAGNNRFIHARNHRYGVTVSALSDPYFQLHYAGARRLY